MLEKLKTWWRDWERRLNANELEDAKRVLVRHYEELAKRYKLGPAQTHQLMLSSLCALADDELRRAYPAACIEKPRKTPKGDFQL